MTDDKTEGGEKPLVDKLREDYESKKRDIAYYEEQVRNARQRVRTKETELKMEKRALNKWIKMRKEQKEDTRKAKSKMSWKPNQIRQYGKKNPMEALARLEI